MKDEFPSKWNVKCKKFYDESPELSDDEESEQNEETSFKRTFYVILNFVIAEKFIQIYSTDVSDELVNELKDLKSIHVPNFGTQPLSPIELLNRIYKSKLQSLFPNGCIALSHCDWSWEFLQ